MTDDHDYPEWTKYSHGTESERRLYKGHVLYVDDYGWWCQSLRWGTVGMSERGPVVDRVHSKAEAEAWAEKHILATGGYDPRTEATSRSRS